MNGDDGVLAIVLAAEHLLDLTGVHQTGEFLDAAGELRRHVLTLGGPLDEHTKVLGAFRKSGHELDFFFDPSAALEDFLRLGLVVPEIGSRRAGFYPGELFSRAGGFKDNS